MVHTEGLCQEGNCITRWSPETNYSMLTEACWRKHFRVVCGVGRIVVCGAWSSYFPILSLILYFVTSEVDFIVL